MDWKTLISEIQAAGHTQASIASYCGCEQTTISALALGKTTDPKHSTGEKLKALHKACRRSKAPAKAEV